jgi:hypothetical protein
MFEAFQYETIPLAQIQLDPQNPRLVTMTPLTTEAQIIEYLFDHEDLGEFLKKFAAAGKNLGAERPYVVKAGKSYTVIEGNTRIAAYKLLTGLASPSQKHKGLVPVISEGAKKQLVSVDCTVAPKREDLLPIMASAHFGLGDKSKWGYLGSRKAVYD